MNTSKVLRTMLAYSICSVKCQLPVGSIVGPVGSLSELADKTCKAPNKVVAQSMVVIIIRNNN